MKIRELLSTFKHGNHKMPTVLWEALVWNAANLLRMAERERGTARPLKDKTVKTDPRQMLLFEESEEKGGDCNGVQER